MNTNKHEFYLTRMKQMKSDIFKKFYKNFFYVRCFTVKIVQRRKVAKFFFHLIKICCICVKKNENNSRLLVFIRGFFSLGARALNFNLQGRAFV